MFLKDDSVRISPRLRTSLAISTFELVSVACPDDSDIRFHAYLPVIKELRDYRDPQGITLLIQYHMNGIKLANIEGTRSSRGIVYSDIAMKALDDAGDLSSLCFGSQHPSTIQLRHDAAEAKKTVPN